jgi:hypothetical protein
VVGLVGG